VRRPQKPFIVEVKRARSGAVAKVLGGVAHEKAAQAPIAPLPEPTPKPVVSPRRILETIEPQPFALTETPSSEPLWPEPPVEIATKEPAPRRSPKRSRVAAADDQDAVTARKSRKSAPPRAEAPDATDAPPVVVRAAASEPPLARVSQAARAEAASRLPRGERWKRRLPKNLW
jgi:hypothetical protein